MLEVTVVTCYGIGKQLGNHFLSALTKKYFIA